MNGFLVLIAALDAIVNPPEKKTRKRGTRSFAPTLKKGRAASHKVMPVQRTGRNRPVRQP